MIGRKGTTYTLQILALTFSASLAAAQQPPPIPQAPAGGMAGGIPKIPTVELTDESAKNAIDAYLTLREKYGEKIPPANQAQALKEGMASVEDVNAVVTGKGFGSTEDWQKAITSVALAQGFLKEGGTGDMDKKIAELEANPQIPAAYKQQMLGMLKGMRPSDNNLNVVKGLLADPTYGEKIAEIRK
jgi:hypothetical protein